VTSIFVTVIIWQGYGQMYRVAFFSRGVQRGIKIKCIFCLRAYIFPLMRINYTNIFCFLVQDVGTWCLPNCGFLDRLKVIAYFWCAVSSEKLREHFWKLCSRSRTSLSLFANKIW